MYGIPASADAKLSLALHGAQPVLGERTGLFSTVEEASVDCFREAEIAGVLRHVLDFASSADTKIASRQGR
jgi:hypothetical protein